MYVPPKECGDECQALRVHPSNGRCNDDDGDSSEVHNMLENRPPTLDRLVQAADADQVAVPASPVRWVMIYSTVLALGVAIGAATGKISPRRQFGGREWTPGSRVRSSGLEIDETVAAGGDGGPNGSETTTGTTNGQVEEFDLEKIPPLSELVDGEKVIGDISWMLDFAIVGYAKSGTTFLMNYLRRGSGEVYIHQGEVHDMARGKPSNVVSLFYEPHESFQRNEKGDKVLFGLKSPEDLETEVSIPTYRKYFPDTKFIVSLRHPVKWFESYYNFRVYHHYPKKMASPEDLIGPCVEGNPYPSVHHRKEKHFSGKDDKQGVCTDRANFHWTLSRLGKTPMSTDKEKRLLKHDMDIVETKNKVFLFEDRQILLSNPASKSFTVDLRDFLGLHQDLPLLKPYEPSEDKYGDVKKYKNRDAAARTIDICDPQHDKVRSVLVDIGKEAAKWITKYFIGSPDVVVSSKNLFTGLLEDWGRDPCAGGQ